MFAKRMHLFRHEILLYARVEKKTIIIETEQRDYYERRSKIFFENL